MPPQTRSRTRIMKATPKETKPAKGGATCKLASKSTSKTPPKKKARNYIPPLKKEPEKLLVIQFANLPLELFLEIAKHLYPLDLIHLSRANKLLRSMFMRRPAAEVWRAAITNTGLPPCPDESMSEPRYAALVFLEQCSECRKPATNCMDPVLLVRLCYTCRKYIRLAFVLTHSQYLAPPRGKARPNWYLRQEYEEIKETVDELEGVNYDAWRAWVQGRAGFVRARHERAKPLVRWLEKRDEEEKQAKRQATNELKNARAAQAREDRLWKEPIQREQDRERITRDWLDSLSKQLPPTNFTLCWKYLENNETVGSVAVSQSSVYPQGVEKHDVTICIPSMPPSYDLIQDCPHLKELLRYDRPMEEFQRKFQEKQSFLTEQYSGWRAKLEAALVKTLPRDLKPVDTQNYILELYPVAHMTDVDPSKSEHHTSVDLRCSFVLTFDSNTTMEHIATPKASIIWQLKNVDQHMMQHPLGSRRQ
ncbi:hypothetical protein B0J17DRAFT_722778 [Rhizoctonia solani]|nr:hypothetical protein B0J17DRAFT_722778 [Rhizoctonia solani]